MTTTVVPASSRGARRSDPARSAFAYLRLLGLQRRTESLSSLLRRVRAGLPFQAYAHFQHSSSFTPQELSEIVGITERTLHRRKAAGRLAPDESDRLLRA